MFWDLFPFVNCHTFLSKCNDSRSITLASIFLELFPCVNFLKEPEQVTHVFRGTPNSSKVFILKSCIHMIGLLGIYHQLMILY